MTQFKIGDRIKTKGINGKYIYFGIIRRIDDVGHCWVEWEPNTPVPSVWMDQIDIEQLNP